MDGRLRSILSDKDIRNKIESWIKEYCPCSNGSNMGIRFIRLTSGNTRIDLSLHCPLYVYRQITGYLICTEQALTAYRSN